MRAGLTIKLMTAILVTLAIAFSGITVIVLKVVQDNNRDLITAVLSEFNTESKASVNSLRTEFDKTASNLNRADQEIRTIVRNLYEMNYSRTLQSFANQIYPLIENFDYDAASRIVREGLEKNKEIRWITFITSEKPKPSDIFEFGKKAEGRDDSIKAFSWQIRDKSSYLKMDMQVDMSGLDAFIDEVKGIFASIVKENKELTARTESAGERSIATVNDIARKIGDAGSEKLGRTIVLLMSGVLLIVSAILFFFTRKAIIVKIRQIIDVLREGAENVASSSSQLSSGSQDLAVSSSRQAASLEETASALKEMSSRTNRNAENTSQANKMVVEAEEILEGAYTSMQALEGYITETSAASDDVAKIIKTIQEVAFQTNLLALNAAVEAARVGEAGAGFAVVADEVRNLARRSAEASMNTEKLLFDIIGKMKKGAELVKETDAAYREVSSSIRSISQAVGEITASSSEQAQEIESINRAIALMEGEVQQNAANAEQSAASSEGLADQAETLQRIVSALAVLLEGDAGNRVRDRENQVRGRNAARPPDHPEFRKGGVGLLPPAERTCGPARR